MFNNINENIRLDCYLAILDKMKKQYPDAHFEVITRTAQSVLSPSFKLLRIAKAGMKFEIYKIALTDELLRSEKAQMRLRKLKEIASKKLVFLVCFEKDATRCHRSLIKEMILDLVLIRC